MQVSSFSISYKSLLPNADGKSIVVLQRYVSTVDHVNRHQYTCVKIMKNALPPVARYDDCTMLKKMHDSTNSTTLHNLLITPNALHDTIRSFQFRRIEARFRTSMLMVTGIVDTVPSRNDNLHIICIAVARLRQPSVFCPPKRKLKCFGQRVCTIAKF